MLHLPAGRMIGRVVGAPPEIIGAVGATAEWVAFGAAGNVGTFLVRVPPGCPAGG
jgi:hypothetical protein